MPSHRIAHIATMILAVVRHLSRWVPRAVPVDGPDDGGWPDSDASCHTSSYELRHGLLVIEHFEPLADTSPAFDGPADTAHRLR
jgi:hypothetical protein